MAAPTQPQPHPNAENLKPPPKMYSSLVRVQNVFGFFTTVAFFITALVTLSSVFFPADPTATIDVRRFRVCGVLSHLIITIAPADRDTMVTIE